jgi:hypothetical protein
MEGMVVDYFQILFWHFLGGAEGNHEETQLGYLDSRP